VHSNKIDKKLALVLKIDLNKAYDKVNWLYLMIVLLYIGMDLQTINWIMGYLSSTSFDVLMNGSPSSFFNASRGIIPTYLLSPFFLLVAEWASRLISYSKREGSIRGIIITYSMVITHLLFVDDIMIFDHDTLREMNHLNKYSRYLL